MENICLYADPTKDYLIAIVVPDKVHFKVRTKDHVIKPILCGLYVQYTLSINRV